MDMKNKIIALILLIVIIGAGVFGYTSYTEFQEKERLAKVESDRIAAEMLKKAEEERIIREAEEKKREEAAKGLYKSPNSDFSWKMIASSSKTSISYVEASGKETLVRNMSGECVAENMYDAPENQINDLFFPIIKCHEKDLYTYLYKKGTQIKMANTKEKCKDFTTCTKFSGTKAIGEFK